MSLWCSVPRKMCSYIPRCLNVLYLKCLRNVLQILGAQSSQGTASRSCKVYFTKFFLFPRYSFIGCRSLSESSVHFRKSRRDHEFFMSSMDFRKYLEFRFKIGRGIYLQYLYYKALDSGLLLGNNDLYQVLKYLQKLLKGG